MKSKELKDAIYKKANLTIEACKLENDIFSACDEVLEKIDDLEKAYKKKHKSFELLKLSQLNTDNCDIEVTDNGTEYLVIRYYEHYGDYYNYETIKLPLEILDSDEKLKEWFGTKTSEYEDRLKKQKKSAEDKEYKKYLELKEKYENKNTL